VLLRGVNVNALVQYWAYGPLPTVEPFDAADAEVMAGIGWNVVRLLVSWSRIEPAPGRYDRGYLREVARLVRVLARHGLYTIIDFHQDAWSATLAARPGEVCPTGSEPAFGWDGAPEWATLDGGAAHCFTLARELSPAVQTAFAAFWADAPGPGGIGIRTRYARMVGHVARRFARLRSVAGYDVMNEPSAFTADQIGVLGDFYAEVLSAVRAAERRRHGFPHLVFFEPSILWSSTGAGTPDDFPHDANVAFAPHVYGGGSHRGRSTPPTSHGPATTPRASAARPSSSASGAAIPTAPVIPPTPTSASTRPSRTTFISARPCGRGASPAATRTRRPTRSPAAFPRCGASGTSTVRRTRSTGCAKRSSTS
jgi:endoglycosylceramidase